MSDKETKKDHGTKGKTTKVSKKKIGIISGVITLVLAVAYFAARRIIS